MNTGQRILEYIDKNGSITAMEAFYKLGTTKLTTRISELRRAGYNIKDTWEISPNGYRHKRYTWGE